MENIMELRCVLEQGAIIKHIMTSALILAAVEAAIMASSMLISKSLTAVFGRVDP